MGRMKTSRCLTALDLRPVENNLVVDDLQKVNSAYTKTATKTKSAEENGMDFVTSSEILYADKNRTASLLRTIGFYMPIELQLSGSMGSIRYFGQNVNISGRKFSDVFKAGDDYSFSRESIIDRYFAETAKLREQLDELKGVQAELETERKRTAYLEGHMKVTPFLQNQKSTCRMAGAFHGAANQN